MYYFGIMLTILGALALIAFRFAPKGWRTVAVNAAILSPNVLLWIADIFTNVNWVALFPPEAAAIVVPIVNVINVILRELRPTGAPQAERIAALQSRLDVLESRPLAMRQLDPDEET